MGAITHNGEVLQSLPANASQINFDKTGTNLNSTQTENAIKEVNTKANTLQSEKADTDIVASDFSTAVSYTAGSYCIYDGKFYKFKNNHSGAWSASDVDEIKIAGELSSLKSGLTIEESGDGNLLHIYKMSKMVAISGSVTLPYAVPEAYRPKSTAFVPCLYNNNTLNYVAIYANGTVAVGDGAYTTGSVIFSAAYATT